MKMQQVKEKAKELGISIGRKKKVDLVRQIQTEEGNTPCYGTSSGDCPYTDCCFMDDCYTVTVK